MLSHSNCKKFKEDLALLLNAMTETHPKSRVTVCWKSVIMSSDDWHCSKNPSAFLENPTEVVVLHQGVTGCLPTLEAHTVGQSGNLVV